MCDPSSIAHAHDAGLRLSVFENACEIESAYAAAEASRVNVKKV